MSSCRCGLSRCNAVCCPHVHAGLAAFPYSVCVFLLSAVCIGQEEALRVHRDIADLTDEAPLIVHGTIASSQVEPHPQFKNLNTVLVTMSVADCLKGSGSKTITFRQYVWAIRSIAASGGYHKGEEVLLFLRPPSQYGLTSPAGLNRDDSRSRATLRANFRR